MPATGTDTKLEFLSMRPDICWCPSKEQRVLRGDLRATKSGHWAFFPCFGFMKSTERCRKVGQKQGKDATQASCVCERKMAKTGGQQLICPTRTHVKLQEKLLPRAETCLSSERIPIASVSVSLAFLPPPPSPPKQRT